jgi:diguanylate cyclase (GGDEF)-like protein
VDRICDLFRQVGNSLDLEETLATIDRELHRLLAYEAISIHLAEGGRLLPVYAAGEEFAALGSLEMEVGRGFLGGPILTGRPAINCRPEGLRLGSALVVPLGQAAVIALYRAGCQAFTDEEFHWLRAAAPKLQAAIGNARAYQLAAKLAGIDPLTGALNARAMFERLDAELARTRRRQERLAVLQCAMEGVGGAPPEVVRSALRRLANALREGCREYDTVARTGDDLVLVLAGFAPADFEEKVARIRAAVDEVGMAVGLPLSARLGAAFFPEDARDAEGLLAAAERSARC